MRISQGGPYALRALTVLAQHPAGVAKVKDKAAEENLSEQVLGATLLELQRARIVISLRRANGGDQLKRPPKETSLGGAIRRIDGPLTRFEDAESMCRLVSTDWKHRSLFRILLDVRNATASILDPTSLSDRRCCSRN